MKKLPGQISTIFKSFLTRRGGTLRRTMSSTDKTDHLQRTAEQQRVEEIYSARVTDMYYISPTVKSIFLSVNTTASYKAGQWLDLMIPGLTKVGGFTMCTSPLEFDKTKILQLAVKYSKHPPTYWIHEQSKVDSEVFIRFGGDFAYDPEPPRDVLLLGGGVGINPLYCTMNYIADLNKLSEGKRPNTMLLYSSSTANELLFKNEMDEHEKNNENIKCRYFVTREKPTGENIKGHRIGKADLEDAFKFIKKEECLAYICGPVVMIESLEQSLKDLGLRPDQILVDKWW